MTSRIAGSAGHHGFVTHWDGRRWTAAALPFVGGSSGLSDITAISRSDVWAVGQSARNLHGQTLIVHWDGDIAWHIVPSPTPAPPKAHRRIYVELDAVTALSRGDVWAVGSTQSLGIDGPSNAVVEHWNGKRWTTVATPQPTGFNQLFSVSATSPTDVWAFGDRNSIAAGYGGGGDHPLALHWDGQSWRVVPPPPAHRRGIFYDSLATAGMAVAVGNQSQTPFKTLIGTTKGHAWVLTPSRPADPSPHSPPHPQVRCGRSAPSVRDRSSLGVEAGTVRRPLHVDGAQDPARAARTTHRPHRNPNHTLKALPQHIIISRSRCYLHSRGTCSTHPCAPCGRRTWRTPGHRPRR